MDSIKVLFIVNSSYGVRNAIGARAGHIVEHLAGKATVLARYATRGARRAVEYHQCGFGATTGKLLKAMHVYVSDRFPHKAILQRAFERDVASSLNRLDMKAYDVIHTWAAVPNEVYAAKERNPRVVVVRDVSMRPDYASGSTLRRESEVIDYFLCPAPAVIEATVDGCGVPADRVFLQPFGADTDLFVPREVPAAEGLFRVAFSGHVDRRKGIPELVEAWRLSGLSKEADARLDLYGRVYPEVRSVLSNAASAHIVTHGFVDLPSTLPNHEAFVLPSHREGSAKAVYEALACGLPVITTREAGSVVRHDREGQIVPAGDAASLAKALRRYYEDSDLRRLHGNAARRRALEFTWGRYGAGVVALYDTMVARGPVVTAQTDGRLR